MPLDKLSSHLDAMEKGILYLSGENLEDDNSQSSSPPISLSSRVVWFDGTSNPQTASGNDSLQCPSRSEMSKPFVNIPEDSSVLSKSSIVNRPCISYQLPHGVTRHPYLATQRPAFFDNRPSCSSAQRPELFGNHPSSSSARDNSIQQQNTSIDFPELLDNRSENAIHYPIQHRANAIHYDSTKLPKRSTIPSENDVHSRRSSMQLPELDTNRRNDLFSRSSSTKDPSIVIQQRLLHLPEPSTSRPDNTIYQADIPRSSTDRTEYIKYPTASIPSSSTNRTQYANFNQASIPSNFTNCTERAIHHVAMLISSNQHRGYPTNRLENGIYCPSVSNQRVDNTIPQQNSSIQRGDSFIGYPFSSVQRSESIEKPPSYAVRPGISSQRSKSFIKNSDNFSQRAECSVIQMF